MRVMDLHVYGIDPVSVIFRIAFAYDTQAPPQASWCGRPSVTTLVFLQGKLYSAHYIAQVVNPMLLPFLRQEGDLHFQQDNAHPHMATSMQYALRGVKLLPWLARTPDI